MHVVWILSLEGISVLQNLLVLCPYAVDALLQLAWLAALPDLNVFYSNTGWWNVGVLRTLRFLVVVLGREHGFVNGSLLLVIDQATLHFLLHDALHRVGHHVGHWVQQLKLGFVLLLAQSPHGRETGKEPGIDLL